jgi:hypothetical protein
MGKLGQLLVARGWITVQQLNRALKNQSVAGGRLGTCLLEMDAISEELLLRGLSEQLGVPSADLEELRSVPEEVLGILPEKLALRWRAVPFRVEGGRLDLALMDPRNLASQDEIAFASGKRVKAYVAHELRVHEALERYYKEECPSRFAHVVERLNRARFFWDRQRAAGEAAPPEPSVTVPILPAPFAPPAPPKAPAARPAPAAPAAAAPAAARRPRTVELTQEEKVELGLWDEAPAPAARPQVEVPESFETAVKALGEAADPEEAGEILIAWVARSFRRAALFRVLRDRISGWTARGESVDLDAFASFSAGFDQPSVFLNLRQGAGMHIGPLPPMPLHRKLAETWGGDLPRDCVVLPVRMKDRLVTILYADGPRKGVAGMDLPRLQQLVFGLASSFERFLVRRKRGETAP